MSSPEDTQKPLKLVDQIEIEVIREPLSRDGEVRTPTTYEANPLQALEEIVERLEELERNTDSLGDEFCSTSHQERSALSDMERHLEQFQKQSAILKRVLLKLH